MWSDLLCVVGGGGGGGGGQEAFGWRNSIFLHGAVISWSVCDQLS